MMTIKRFGVLGVLVLFSVCRSYAASPIFINFGTLTNVPQIDAVSFVNHGLFSVSAILPYETQNTLYFTNTGRMDGSPGFRLENISSSGKRQPASSIYNAPDAVIYGGSGIRFGSLGTGPNAPLFGFTFENSQTRLWATNIVNKGHLRADASGLVRVEGQAVDLSRSSLGILPFNGGFGFVTPTNFFPEVGVFDLYWGMNNDGSGSFGPGSLARPIRQSTNFMVNAPQHRVTNQLSAFGFNQRLALTNALSFVITNAVTPTNWVVQAVFVQVTSPELAVDVRFSPSSIQTNPYQTAIVEFSNRETNVLEGGEFLTQLYLLDRLASETNFVLLTNLLTLSTYMPGNYEVTRLTPIEFLGGGKANPSASTNANVILQNSTYTNTTVTNLYSAYGFNVTNVSYVPPNIAGVSYTNLPGRVEIAAGDLNLNRTRIRGEGIVTVTATNMTGTNAVMDVQNLSLNLGSSSGNLKIQNFIRDTVERTAGDILAWSTMWTNQATSMSTNMVPDPMDATQTIAEVVTNVIDIGFHVLVVDSSQVITQVPVQTANLEVHSSNFTLGDTVRIVESALFDTENFVVLETGRILMGPGEPDLNAVNMPRALSFISAGELSMPGSLFLGMDRERSYVTVINSGSIGAFNIAVRSQFFENTGTIEAGAGQFLPLAGGIVIESERTRLLGGAFSAIGDVKVSANDLTMSSYSIETDQSVVFVVPNLLSDGGVPEGNYIKSEGFHILALPATGDFLGTTFESVAPPFIEIPHTSAGEDRGPTRAGFLNNAAIGHLILDGKIESLFRFRGTGQKNALYIDFLELRGSTALDVLNSIYIDPNLVVYFAASNVSADLLNGLFPDAGAPEGRLRWVSNFAGPSSAATVTVQSSNSTVLMNRSLRESSEIDSDGDGIANGSDAFPLDADPSTRVSVSSVGFSRETGLMSFSWTAQANQTYVIEFTTDLGSGNWQLLSRYTNSGTVAVAASGQDKVPAGTPQRFYRIRPVAK